MRGYLISIWSLFDPIYLRCRRLTHLPKTGTHKNIFRVRLTKYKGRNIILTDGTPVNKNDTLIKIHLHNVRLLKELKKEKSEVKKARFIYRYVQNSLPGIENYMRNHKKSEQIKGIIGITSLNKGCERLGFEVVPITNPIYKLFKWTSSLPITLISQRDPSQKRIYQPSYLLMSKHKLTSLYQI